MVIKQDSVYLCRRLTDAAIDELTAYVDIWQIWQAMPRGRQEAAKLRLYDRLVKVIGGGGDSTGQN
ncbi:hypothetical protein ES705_13542 [subsurface metagenome]